MNPALKVWQGQDGIVRVECPRDSHITLEALQAAHAAHRRITTEKAPVLMCAESVTSADYDAQQFASDEQVVEIVSCMAIIVKSAFTRAMANLFMKFHKPPYPTRVFSSESEALDWLASCHAAAAAPEDRSGEVNRG